MTDNYTEWDMKVAQWRGETLKALESLNDDISEIKNLLSPKTVAQKFKNGENIRNSQNNVKENPKGKRGNKRKKGSDYDVTKD